MISDKEKSCVCTDFFLMYFHSKKKKPFQLGAFPSFMELKGSCDIQIPVAEKVDEYVNSPIRGRVSGGLKPLLRHPSPLPTAGSRPPPTWKLINGGKSVPRKKSPVVRIFYFCRNAPVVGIVLGLDTVGF